MKNYEKYGRELKKYRGGEFCDDYVKPDVLKLKKDDECDHDCIRCLALQMIWLLEEYEEPKEPKVDWSKVEVDTPILVRQGKNGTWLERHFAKYENGDVYAWVDGQTSWTGAEKIKWKYAKLAEDAEENKESEVDWNEVKVDTPILVRDSENEEWLKKYFAKYEDGLVYVWNLGRTSWTAPNKSVSAWKYAKLAEPEVDWNKVEVDTPILVKDYEDAKWSKRHFAKYENGIIYAWQAGCTSQSIAVHMSKWKYAKLAENEETK